MIKVGDLRLGNLISHNGENVPVVQIERRYKTIFRINDIDVDERIIGDTYQSIPLTREWLGRCGFESFESIQHNEYESEDRHTIRVNETNISVGFVNETYGGTPGKSIRFNFGGDYLSLHKPLEYVHQLQNLYHVLTGEELIITL